MTGRAQGAWTLGAVSAWFLGGWLAAAAVAVTALIDWRRGVSGRWLLTLALAMLAAVPVVWLVSNRTRFGRASPDLVTQAPWPGRLALVALTLLCVGVALDVLASGRPTAPTSGEQE